MAAPPPSDVSTPYQSPAGSMDLDSIWKAWGPMPCLRFIGALWDRQGSIPRSGPAAAFLAWLRAPSAATFDRDWVLSWQPAGALGLAQLVVMGMDYSGECRSAFRRAVDEVGLSPADTRAVARSRAVVHIRMAQRSLERFGEAGEGLHMWAIDVDGTCVHGPTVPMRSDIDWRELKAAGTWFEEQLKEGQVTVWWRGKVCQ